LCEIWAFDIKIFSSGIPVRRPKLVYFTQQFAFDIRVGRDEVEYDRNGELSCSRSGQQMLIGESAYVLFTEQFS
jgi:hypothetical protein